MDVTLVGAGRMARGIATRALVGGHQVRLVDRDRATATALARDLGPGAEAAGFEALDETELVVLALPFASSREVAREHADQLVGTVVVDISNPVDFATFDALTVPAGTSAAELIAAEAPLARVVKAFNTTFAGTLRTGEVGGQPLDVFVAGDDEAAKAMVAELVRGGGLRPVDAGPLRRARELENVQFLHMTLQDRLGLEWSSAIKLLPRRRDVAATAAAPDR